jgi:hypothetical protein
MVLPLKQEASWKEPVPTNGILVTDELTVSEWSGGWVIRRAAKHNKNPCHRILLKMGLLLNDWGQGSIEVQQQMWIAIGGGSEMGKKSRDLHLLGNNHRMSTRPCLDKIGAILEHSFIGSLKSPTSMMFRFLF